MSAKYRAEFLRYEIFGIISSRVKLSVHEIGYPLYWQQSNETIAYDKILFNNRNSISLFTVR